MSTNNWLGFVDNILPKWAKALYNLSLDNRNSLVGTPNGLPRYFHLLFGIQTKGFEVRKFWEIRKSFLKIWDCLPGCFLLLKILATKRPPRSSHMLFLSRLKVKIYWDSLKQEREKRQLLSYQYLRNY